VVAPGAAEGLAGLPDHRLALHGDPALGLVLLRGDEVLGDVGAVVDDDARLEAARELDELLALPVPPALALETHLLAAGVGEVIEHDVYLAEPREQFLHLRVEVGGVLADVPFLVHLGRLRVAPQGVQEVYRELRVMPVNEGVIETHPQPLRAERLHHRPDEVLAPGRVGHLVVRLTAVPQTEAVVVLGGHHEVPHPGPPGHPRPLGRVVEVRIEMIEVTPVLLIAHLLGALDPLVASRAGIDAPVDEHPEALANEPPGITRRRHGPGHPLLSCQQ